MQKTFGNLGENYGKIFEKSWTCVWLPILDSSILNEIFCFIIIYVITICINYKLRKINEIEDLRIYHYFIKSSFQSINSKLLN